MKKELTPERLREVLSYNFKTGKFMWIKRLSQRGLVGQECTVKSISGYAEIGIDGKRYRAHRLAWLYVYGIWPIHYIDHINGVRDDNRWVNLRHATRNQNLANMKPMRPVKGAYPNTNGTKWSSRIRVNGKTLKLGTFDTEAEAGAAYAEAAQKYHGEFARSK